MLIPMSLSSTVIQQSSRIVLSALPTAAALAFASSAADPSTTTSTTTQLHLGGSEDDTSSALTSSSGPTPTTTTATITNKMQWPLPPRAVATIYMAAAMTLHFSGYEFIRNACLSLFTSSERGFSHPAAFPLANALISPFSLLLLWGYSQQLNKAGPRMALRNTTAGSIAMICLLTSTLLACQYFKLPAVFQKAVIGLAFMFQNSYQHLIYTQQWSFVGSIVTPAEGAKWFAVMTGTSSLLCSVAGSAVPYIVPVTGVTGLMGLTAITLTGTLVCADRAYALAGKHGFDPAAQQPKKALANEQEPNRVVQAAQLFRRVPTLAVLFAEVLSFQSLSTILNVAFVRSLKNDIVDDALRAAYTGRFYAAINAVSAALQFVAVPLFLKFTQPAWIWRLMPVIPVAICMRVLQGTNQLTWLAAAFFSAKVMDYAIRSVLYVMVYQPLDFESRYVGKEIIGIFGSRFGKSGMSLILSALTAVGLTAQQQLGQLSLVASLVWTGATWSLSKLLPSQAEAQAVVEKRKRDEAASALKKEE